MAMSLLGGGLSAGEHHEDALTVQEAELATMRRFGGSEQNMFVLQGNLASTYEYLGRVEEALRLKRDVYTGFSRLFGEEHENTFKAANNYAWGLLGARRFEEAKALMRKTIPVARRVLGEGNEHTLRMRFNYGKALYRADGATLEDLRKAVTTLEDTERTARRVLGGARPLTKSLGNALHQSRAILADHETPPPSA